MASPRAIQIITPVNHEFQLQEADLKKILGADAIKDRQCVVISIAGAFRKGKSFLLNFFLRYLHAQVKKKYWIFVNENIRMLNVIETNKNFF